MVGCPGNGLLEVAVQEEFLLQVTGVYDGRGRKITLVTSICVTNSNVRLSKPTCSVKAGGRSRVRNEKQTHSPRKQSRNTADTCCRIGTPAAREGLVGREQATALAMRNVLA